jgi:hypothetical protein
VKAVDVGYVRDEFKKRHATGEADPQKRRDSTKKAFVRALNQDATLRKEYPRWSDGDHEWIWRLKDEPQTKPGPVREGDMGDIS